MPIRLPVVLCVFLVGCGPSSATFATQYPTTDSFATAIERGAPKLGCRSETSFHGEDIHCGERSVKLIENGGHYDAECNQMSKGECKELLEKMVDAGSSGS